MAIDRTFQHLAAATLAVLTAACAAVPRVQPPPPPAPRPATPPLPAPTPPPAPTDWRDAPQTPGDWSWRISGGRSQASFGLAGSPVATLTCDSASRTVLLARTGDGSVAAPVTVRSTFALRTLSSDPAAGASGWIAIRLPARDPLLDQIAFSRGRFSIEVGGQPTLYLPSWPEVSRVIEDCR